MKYGIWKVSQLEAGAVNALVGSGYAPLAAMVLASRGIGDDRQARAYLDCNAPLLDPFLMTDMDKAAGRVGLAMSRGEKIAVFGDYDVDGITATCLLTDFLRRHGADVVSYIPGRLEEGYGLNPIAIHQLHAEGVKLIVTVDCGITAVSEAELCKQLGIDLVITDHHECKQTLPAAVAVVDPHRCDGGYPHKNLSGVGVAFKLASALCGSQETVLEEYADMVCLGTVADVMPLQGENRVFVARGLESLAHTKRPGIAALMAECGCAPETVSASSIGFMLAPRINAAGRMGQIDLAVELFLTDDPDKAAEAARAEAASQPQPAPEAGPIEEEPAAETPEPPAQEPSLTEKELTAYRRAEQTERNAAVRARRIYAQLSNLCEDARTRYMDSGEEIAALAADLSTGLSRLQDAFAEVQVIFDDAQNAFDDMQLPETAAEETAE